jgi:hypothetical protein
MYVSQLQEKSNFKDEANKSKKALYSTVIIYVIGSSNAFFRTWKYNFAVM